MQSEDDALRKPARGDDPWASLRVFTAARIALGRTGTAIPLQQTLAFRMAHAHARDAVYSSLDLHYLEKALAITGSPVSIIHSKAADRHQYLQRPDLGRSLDETSRQQLSGWANTRNDVALIVADGLSAAAINRHAVPVVHLLAEKLQQEEFSLGPICLVQQGRVAIGDDIGHLLHAALTVVLIGERPGLSAPDSMGAYLTYQPKLGLTDAARNCVSNIRPEGLSYVAAAEKILYLVRAAFRLQQSGTALKDIEAGLHLE